MCRTGIVLFLAGFLFSFYPTRAQDPDTVHLKEIQVSARQLGNYAIGSTVVKILPETIRYFQTQTLADLLASESGISIKSYGPGGLASMSVRGGGSAHTSVIWNGINLQNPMSGGVNLSALPAGLFEEVALQYGGNGTGFGSGALTGVVHLAGNRFLEEKNSLKLTTGFGSFDDRSVLMKAKYGNQRNAGLVKAFWHSAENDFPFLNTAKFQSPIEKQSNAAGKQLGMTLDSESKLSNHTALSLHGWYQKADKDVQTRMTDALSSRANQKDHLLLLAGDFRYEKSGYKLLYQSGFAYNQILYLDPVLTDSLSDNHSRSWTNSLTNEFTINENQQIIVGLSELAEAGFSDEYQDVAKRNRWALYSSYKMRHWMNRLTAVFSLRSEVVDGALIPPVFSINGSYTLHPEWILKSNLSKNYRLPAFNDLYWKAGTFAQGNPELVPETGWTGDLGLHYTRSLDQTELLAQTTWFYNSIMNWIIWLPNEAGIWKPLNKESGRSLGTETTARLEWSIPKSKIRLHTAYYWTHTRLFSADNYNNKSLIYVPEHQVKAGVSYSRKDFSAGYTHNYYSKRYYDHQHSLDPYHLGMIFLSYGRVVKGVDLNLSLKINNVWNTPYQVMAWYAMPLRNYAIQLNIRI